MRITALRLFIGLLFTFLSGVHADPSHSLLIFGDSLSDTGAGYMVSQSLGMPAIPPSPYYHQGRYSDGPGWVDYIKENLHIECLNYAIGGAQSGDGQTLARFGYDMGGLFQQIDRFAEKYQEISPTTIVVVAIGSNDFLSLLFTPNQLNIEGVTRRVQQVVTNIKAACERLEMLGARSIVLWNIPDLGRIPKFNKELPLNLLAPLMSAAAVQCNIALADFVRKWNVLHTDLRITQYDAHGTLTSIAHELAQEGVDLTAHRITCYLHCNPPYVEITGPEDVPLFFHDQTHPTSIVWQRFAQQFQHCLIPLIYEKSAPLPEAQSQAIFFF